MYRNPTPPRNAAHRAARTTTTYRPLSARRLYCLGVLLPTLAVAAVGGIASAAESHPATVAPSQAPRVCFPASHWAPAPDSIRPCVRITSVEEDGSFSYRVTDADGTTRYTSGVGALDR